MEVLLLGVALLLLVAPAAFASRGVGNKWGWFGAGAALLVAALFLALRKSYDPGWRGIPGERLYDFEDDPDIFNAWEGFCFFASIAFGIAGFCYKSRPKEPRILGK